MNPFTTALVKAPQRARFDFNHSNTVGLRLGALTPTLTEFIVPGDEVSLSLEQICRLAPMPVPTFTPLKVRHDFFFVPLRLLYGNDYLDRLFGSSSSDRKRAYVRNLEWVFRLGSRIRFDDPSDYGMGWIPVFGPGNNVPYPVAGSLMDYLGFPVMTDRNGGLTEDMLSAISQGDTFCNVLRWSVAYLFGTCNCCWIDCFCIHIFVC